MGMNSNESVNCKRTVEWYNKNQKGIAYMEEKNYPDAIEVFEENTEKI